MELSASELPRRPEFAAWLQHRQRQLRVTATTKTPGGQTVDWVPIQSQSAEPIATPPPAWPSRKTADVDAKRPTQGATVDAAGPGPPGHVPILRPDLSKVPGTTTLGKYLSKRGGLKINARRRREAAPTDPTPVGYFHATSGQSAINFGCEAWYNVWDPRVDIPSSPGDDHSITQTWLQNYDRPQTQSIEVGLTVDQMLNGDTANHLFTYFTTNGYTTDADNLGGYNRVVKGWQQVHASIFPGIRINGSSTPGSQLQLEIGLKLQLYNGNWWLGFNNDESGPWAWLGYYPASLFAGGLGNHASWASFGGEVYSALPNPCVTADQMGSGRQASAGYGFACFQRNMRYQSDAAGTMADFAGTPETDTAAANCPAGRYTIQTFMKSGSDWASYQFFGGPV